MGYRIDYSTGQAKKKKLSALNKTAAAKASGVIAVVLLLTVLLSIGGPQIKDFLIPGNPEITESALQEMAADIQEGEGFRDAFAAFCQKIIDGAALYE